MELFNEVDEISNNISVNILADLLETVFTFKELPVKEIKYGKVVERPMQPRHRPHQSLDISKIPQAVQRRVNSITETPLASQDIKVLEEHPLLKIKRKLKPSNSKLDTSISSMSDSRHCEFTTSKSFLLGKFLTKMGISKEEISEREKSPAKEFLNRSMELQEANDSKSYIKLKKYSRPSSATPRSGSSSKPAQKKVLKVNQSNRNLKPKKRTLSSKDKNILLGSRFYKKIDEKFVEVLSEKLKKEPFDFKRIKNSSFEEYMKKKNHYILMNKSRWVNETLRVLETSDFLHKSNENDLGQEDKHDAMLDYLSQEKRIPHLIRKAEHLEMMSRKGR